MRRRYSVRSRDQFGADMGVEVRRCWTLAGARRVAADMNWMFITHRYYATGGADNG